MNKQKAIFENQNNTMLIHIALRAEDHSQNKPNRAKISQTGRGNSTYGQCELESATKEL